MAHRFWAALVCAVVVVLAVGRFASTAEARTPQAYVVLIGISQYQDKQILPRPHAEDDVKALYDLFTAKGNLGVDAKHIRLLLGSRDTNRQSEPATRASIIDALQWVRLNARTDDLVVFGFFGEGGPVGDGGQRRCYFASDSTVKDRATNAVSANEIGEEFDKIKSQRLCVLLDVNFKGTDSTPPLDVSLGETAYQEFLGDDTTSRHGPLAGRVLYVATNGLAAGIDLKEHSLFGQALLNGLQGAADKDGYEPDGQITTEELGSWLDKEMPRLKREFAPDTKRVDHFVAGPQTNRFALTYNPEAHAKVEKQVEKLVQLIKDKKISEELAQEGKGLLERMPNLEARQALRKEFQKLIEGNQTLDQFQHQRDKLLESMKISAISARSFAKKVMDAVAVVTDRYVKETNPGDLVNNAIRGTYRRLDEPVPQEVSDQLAKAKKMSSAELSDLLVDVRTRLGKREDLDDHKDVDLALQRMLSPLDPYTTYVGPVEKSRFKLELEADYSGIGATIRKDEATDLVRIVSPIKGGPAYKLGIQADDLIETIARDVDSDGIALAKTEVLETKDMAQTDVVRKLLGKAGTKVTLSIRRGEKTLPFVIERGRVQLETVVGFKRLADDSWDFMIDPDKKIGYVRLTQFAPTTAEELKSAMRVLKRQGMKSLVLDLRFNPGGMLDISGDVADVFIDDQQVVSIRPRKGRAYTITGRKEGSMTDFPMVCLVNGHSASASEIVSACLQDHDRAKIAGSRSYGKGSVQTVMDFDGGSLKLTFATFWRPNGKNLNKLSTDGKDEDEWGVKPDKGFELVLPKGEEDSLYEAQRKQEVIRHDTKEVEKPFKDRQLDLALEYLRRPGK